MKNNKLYILLVMAVCFLFTGCHNEIVGDPLKFRYTYKGELYPINEQNNDKSAYYLNILESDENKEKLKNVEARVVISGGTQFGSYRYIIEESNEFGYDFADKTSQCIKKNDAVKKGSVVEITNIFVTEKVDFSTMSPMGGLFRVKFVFYTDEACSSEKGYIYTPKLQTFDFTFDEKYVIVAIGDEKQYCNIDALSNLNFINSGIPFVDIAYSQIGYIYKGQNKDLNICGTTKAGKTYDKYSDFIKSSKKTVSEKSGINFVRWVLSKTGAKIELDDKIYNIMKWAYDNNRSYNDVNKMQNGDLRVYDGPEGKTLSIIYEDVYEEKWYSISVDEIGGKYYKVTKVPYYDSKTSKVIPPNNKYWREQSYDFYREFISMEGITY